MSSKAEKRLARKALKLEKDLQKSARQFADPQVTKSVVEERLTPHQMLMILDRAHEDCKDAWTWGLERRCLLDSWDDVLAPFFSEYCRKRWGEIDAEMTGPPRRRRKKHVYYAFEKLVDEAYARLVDLQLDDFAPDIFRFRLSGRRRIFGFRIEATATFYSLWYDPEHSIYKG